jgi:hypothetical protein
MILSQIVARWFSKQTVKCVILHPVSFPKYVSPQLARDPSLNSILQKKLWDWLNLLDGPSSRDPSGDNPESIPSR